MHPRAVILEEECVRVLYIDPLRQATDNVQALLDTVNLCQFEFLLISTCYLLMEKPRNLHFLTIDKLLQVSQSNNCMHK